MCCGHLRSEVSIMTFVLLSSSADCSPTKVSSVLPGRCDTNHLKVHLLENVKHHPAPPPHPTDPPQQEEEADDPVTGLKVELSWENQPPPPRGDIPNHLRFLDYVEGELQDHVAPSCSQFYCTGRTGPTQRRAKVSVVLDHSTHSNHIPCFSWTVFSVFSFKFESYQ